MIVRLDYDAAEKELKGAKSITVKFPNGIEHFVVGNELNIPEGKITMDSAISNVPYWRHRGFEVTISK